MNRLLILFMVCLLPLVSFSQAVGPRIRFEKTEYDAGCVEQGDQLHLSFDFRNVGDRPLQILRVPTNTGAAISTFPKDPIPPGQGGSIEISFLTAGKLGPQRKSVSVCSNDSLEPVKTLTYEAWIIPRSQFTPYASEMTEPSASTPSLPNGGYKTSIKLPNNCQEGLLLSPSDNKPLVFYYQATPCGDPLHFKALHRSRPDIQVQYNTGPIQAGQLDSIRVWLNPRKPGPFSETVILETDTDFSPLIYLHINGTVKEQ